MLDLILVLKINLNMKFEFTPNPKKNIWSTRELYPEENHFNDLLQGIVNPKSHIFNPTLSRAFEINNQDL